MKIKKMEDGWKVELEDIELATIFVGFLVGKYVDVLVPPRQAMKTVRELRRISREC